MHTAEYSVGVHTITSTRSSRNRRWVSQEWGTIPRLVRVGAEQSGAVALSLTLAQVALVDAFNVVEQQLEAALDHGALGGGGGGGSGIVAKLRRDLWSIYDALPRDVQQTLSFSPHHAANLQGKHDPGTHIPGHVVQSRAAAGDARGGGGAR
jgi:hypothetical protein